MKSSLSHWKKILVVSILFYSISVHNAYAYLDPGSGSLIIQVLIAFALGISYYIKINWKKLITFFNNHFPKRKKGSENDG